MAIVSQRNTQWGRIVLLGVALGVSAVGLSEAYAGHGFRIEEFGLGTKPVGPAIVKVAEDDTVWVALALAKKIAHVANDGTLLREYPLFSNSFPVGVVEDHSGKVWYADAVRNAIASVEPDTGVVKEYAVPTPAAWPFFMILDSKGTIWFTERMGNKIGRFDPQTKQFEEYPLPTAHSQPAGMAVTYDDHVFFTENSNHKVGHLAPGAKTIEEYAVPSMLKKDPYYGLAGIFAAPNGDIWFAELDGGLGLVKRQGNQYLPVQEIPVPDPSGRPAGVFVDRSGKVWFTELDGNRIGRFDPKTKQFHKYLIPTGAPDRRPLAPPEKTARGTKAGKDGDKAKTSRPFGIFGDSKGNIWFSEQYGHQLGKLVLGGGALKSERPKQAADDKAITIRNDQCGRVTSPALLRVVAGEQVAWRLGGAVAEGTRYTVSEVAGDFELSCEGPNVTDCQHRFWREGEYRYVAEGDKWSVEGQVLVGPRTVTMKEYELPRKDSVPGVLELDGEGNVWFTEIGGFPLPGLGHIPPGNRIGRISSTGEISEFETPTPASAPTSLKVARDGTVWFTEQRANNIAFLDPRRGVIEEIQLPTPNSSPVGIAVDEERGWIWFTEKVGSKIGYLDPETRSIREFLTPTPKSEPSTIAVDADGYVWFDERGADKIVRFDVNSGAFREYALPATDTRIVGVTPDNKGRIWFVELTGNKVGVLEVASGRITEFAIPTQGSFPFKLVLDKKGRVWFTEVFGNKIGRWDGRDFIEFSIPTVKSLPGGIAIDSEGNIWFTQQAANKVAMIPNGAGLP